MANKDWWESFSPADCLKIGSWEDMVDYIQHSACTDFTIYSQCTDTNPVFKFGGNNDIEFDGDRAIMIDDDETYIGHGAGDSITTGTDNTLIGHDAGIDITDGISNIAVGSNAMAGAISGNYNVAIGNNVLDAALTGDENVGVGYQALSKVLAGEHNTAIGTKSMRDLTTGANNTAVGFYAGRDVAVDSNNCVYLGAYAGKSNTQNDIIAVGYRALQKNTGSFNTAVGYLALTDNTSGSLNTALGYWSLQNKTTGYGNTGLGSETLNDLTTGGTNTAVGNSAGRNTAVDIDACVFLGQHAGRVCAASNRLYINNSSSEFPLIYGEFDNDIVKFGNSSDAFFFKFSVDANDAIIETEETDRSIYLKPTGTGLVKFGTYAAKGAEAFAGIITMEDEGGTPRKVMICA